MLDIRSGVSATLQGGPSSAVSSVTLVDTPALEKIRSRYRPDPRSHCSEHYCNTSSTCTLYRALYCTEH